MYWNKRIAILVSALVIAAVGSGILAFLRRPSLESLSGLSGPAEISVVATEGKSDWTDYATGSDTRLAIRQFLVSYSMPIVWVSWSNMSKWAAH